MPELKPAYLVSGDDDTRIDAWRARVRDRAEAEAGPGALERFDAHTHSPEEVAAAIAALSLAGGTRYLLVDAVHTWKAKALEPIERELGAMPPDTVLVLVARGKAPSRLRDAVERAGGELRECPAPRRWELPRWLVERAREEGLDLDGAAAKALVAAVGPRQQRLLRELERLALAVHPRTAISVEDVERLSSREASAQTYDLADALASGTLEAALSLSEELSATGERPSRLVFPIVRRLTEVQRAARLLDSGVPAQKVGATLKLPPWAAKRVVAQAEGADRERLERALCALSDLELELRGGGERSELDEDTAFSLTLARAAG